MLEGENHEDWVDFQIRCANAGMEAYCTGTWQWISVHKRGQCAGEFCTIHNPSDHHMKDWATNWRGERGIMERICPHGVGHPDPDDLAFLGRVGRDAKTESIHGCDGCCMTLEEAVKHGMTELYTDSTFYV